MRARDDVLLLASALGRNSRSTAGRTGCVSLESADLPGLLGRERRELENALQRAVVVSKEVITPADACGRFRGARRQRCGGQRRRAPPLPLAEIEPRAIRAAVERHGGNLTEAADELGIGRSTLYRKLREQQAGASARAVARELLAERR